MEVTGPRIEALEETSTYGKFQVEPLERGYGTTLGNSLRRVLLSSLPGAAITHVKIDKVLHEFATIPGVKEDTTELLFNLKDLYVRVLPSVDTKEKVRTLKIHKRGEGRVTGADVECPPDVEVVNPEVYLATIASEDATLSIELTVEVGTGYMLPDKQESFRTAIGVIPMGASYTPARKVSYTVEATRVGFKTDYERLVLEVTTNGSIRPSAAIREAAKILQRYFQMFVEFKGLIVLPESSGQSDDSDIHAPDARIEELNFTVRTFNCLKKANIHTIADLTKLTSTELLQIRNLGNKSLDEVREKLQELGLVLRGDSPHATVLPAVEKIEESKPENQVEEMEEVEGVELADTLETATSEG